MLEKEVDSLEAEQQELLHQKEEELLQVLTRGRARPRIFAETEIYKTILNMMLTIV